jgi:protein gp37
MGEIFGSWVERSWVHSIFRVIWNCSGNETYKAPKHIFQILTKAPNNISSFFPITYTFPPNLWLGTTVEDQSKTWRIAWITDNLLKHNGVRFVSFEPLLGPIEYDLKGIDWVIIGAQTNPYKPPKREWVQSLIEQARDAGASVFLKDNLRWKEKIQEFPDYLHVYSTR